MILKTRNFAGLSASELRRVARDEALAEFYIDALGMMHDLLCPFVANHGKPQWGDPNQPLAELAAMTSARKPSFLRRPAAGFLVKNLEENRQYVEALRTDALNAKGAQQVQNLQWEISQFLDSLVEAFQEVGKL